MPPKAKKGAEKGKGGEEEREDPLQAVVSLSVILMGGNREDAPSESNRADYYLWHEIDSDRFVRDEVQTFHDRET